MCSWDINKMSWLAQGSQRSHSKTQWNWNLKREGEVPKGRRRSELPGDCMHKDSMVARSLGVQRSRKWEKANVAEGERGEEGPEMRLIGHGLARLLMALSAILSNHVFIWRELGASQGFQHEHGCLRFLVRKDCSGCSVRNKLEKVKVAAEGLVQRLSCCTISESYRLDSQRLPWRCREGDSYKSCLQLELIRTGDEGGMGLRGLEIAAHLVGTRLQLTKVRCAASLQQGRRHTWDTVGDLSRKVAEGHVLGLGSLWGNLGTIQGTGGFSLCWMLSRSGVIRSLGNFIILTSKPMRMEWGW